MSKFDEVLRDNAGKIKDAKKNIETIKKMREAGFAKGPTALRSPNSGRYDLSSPKTARGGRMRNKHSDDA